MCKEMCKFRRKSAVSLAPDAVTECRTIRGSYVIRRRPVPTMGCGGTREVVLTPVVRASSEHIGSTSLELRTPSLANGSAAAGGAPLASNFSTFKTDPLVCLSACVAAQVSAGSAREEVSSAAPFS
jgi:hypothetical protein